MKKWNYSLWCMASGIALAGMISSCGGKKESATAEGEDTFVEDSLAKAQQKTVDLTFQDLHGPVLRMLEDGVSYYYSEDGTLLEINSFDPFTDLDIYHDGLFYAPINLAKRDEKGRICSISGWEWLIDYAWDGEQLASEDGAAEGDSWKTKYIYGEDGRLASTEGTQESVDEEVVPFKNTYKYTQLDAYGNWTQREVTNTTGDTYTQERTITYYPIERVKGESLDGSFNPDFVTYKLKGTIGGESNVEAEIGPTDGYYTLKSGKRVVKIGFFNKETGTLTLYAYLNGRYIGIFEGMVENGVYKGTFMNSQNYDTIDFSLQIEK